MIYLINIFGEFNILNTFIFSIIIIFFYFLFYKIISKYIIIDYNFVYSVIPFLIFGGLLRVLEQDYSSVGGIVNCSTNLREIGFYFCTPGFLILIFLIFLLFLSLSIFLSKKTQFKYNFILNIFSYSLVVPLLIYTIYNFTYFYLFILIFLFVFFILFLINFIFKYLKSNLLNSKINKLVLFSELLDGCATSIGLLYFKDIFIEQHILSRTICNISPFLFLFLKIIFTLLFLYLVDKYIIIKEENIYVKLIIIILSILTGFRTTLSVSLFV
jgi:uncharacterized membrane protein